MMELPTNKAALVENLHRERAFWDALVRVVREQDMLSPGVVGDWTFKDAVVHLTYWRRRTVARFVAALPGGEPLPPEWWVEVPEDVQQANAQNYRANRDRSLTDVLDESREVWQQLVDAVEALPEADLLQAGRFDWMAGSPLAAALYWSYGHLHEHAAQINDWLARLLE
jgi:hypothetical protein